MIHYWSLFLILYLVPPFFLEWQTFKWTSYYKCTIVFDEIIFQESNESPRIVTLQKVTSFYSRLQKVGLLMLWDAKLVVDWYFIVFVSWMKFAPTTTSIRYDVPHSSELWLNHDNHWTTKIFIVYDSLLVLLVFVLYGLWELIKLSLVVN